MKFAVILAVVGVAVAAKLPSAPIPVVAILRNSQINPDVLGAHSSDFEADNGIAFKFSGSEGVTGGANHVGEYSYLLEDGTVAKVTYVADENGFQPQSDLLPVAPLNPHPMPQHAIDQIEKARLEDEAKALEEAARI
ncbi:hypothetical protein Pmani_003852 [Petrolisthes manimaculis]|uniref:Uncharacterized protein n=1 Tax=Petrolisthes manimaculis TaxID=1843537 RepID=A0AAE1UNW6_9EUCA|nr:hypothetical protein Pmani_003852 [Petrolisthes manimaculis]